MIITVIADTHGDFDTLYEIVMHNRDSDCFIHLGDGENEYSDVRSVFPEKAFLFVKGNNDWGNFPQRLVSKFGGKKLYLCHGHSFMRPELSDYLSATASVNGCDAALFGHTHMPYNEIVNGILLFNPGSPSLPRGGFPPSYGKITINDDGTMQAVHCRIDF